MTRFALGITLFTLCLATAAHAATDDVPATLRAMLADYRRYAETLWHTADGHPDMGYWGTGRADWNNEGARAVSNTALVYATLYANGDRAFLVNERIEPALRYETAIHTGGPLQSTDGKQWGESWQSAMWAANLGVAAFLVKDHLDPNVLASVERVLADEADRFITMPVPDMLPGDTKAEENAWDLTAPAAALLLMPNHPHAKDWDKAVQRWAYNTLSVEADKGKFPLVTTAQLFPDYTLDNHGFFHPVYAMVAPATLGQAAVDYRLAKRPIPDGLKFNVLKEWDTLKYITLPDGEWLYPQGLDWELHDYEHIHYWTMLATLYKDPVAALLEKRTMDASRRRQQMNGDGRFVGPSSRLGFAREAVQAERTAFALMMHQQFGPPPAASEADWDRMVKKLDLVKSFDRAGFIVHRTERGIASFSWKNHLMALVVPDSRKHLDQPYVTTPMTDGLTGGFTIEGQPPSDAGRFTVSHVEATPRPNGFTVSVDAAINNGLLRQQIAFASMAPGVVAYLDRVTANKDLVVTEARGLPVGIENDELNLGDRQLYLPGRVIAMAGGQAGDHPIASRSVNVDARLLMIVPEGNILYRSAGPYNRSGAREDTLFGDYSSERKVFRAGDIVAQRAAVLVLDSPLREQATLAGDAVTVSWANGLGLLHFVAPGGRSCTLGLGADGKLEWREGSLPAPKNEHRGTH